MTVRELIEALQKCNPDSQVYRGDGEWGMFRVDTVHEDEARDEPTGLIVFLDCDEEHSNDNRDPSREHERRNAESMERAKEIAFSSVSTPHDAAVLAAADKLVILGEHPVAAGCWCGSCVLMRAAAARRKAMKPKVRFVDMGSYLYDKLSGQTYETAGKSHTYALVNLLNELHEKASRAK